VSVSWAIAASTKILPSLSSLKALELIDKPLSRYGAFSPSPIYLLHMVPNVLKGDMGQLAYIHSILPSSASFIARPPFPLGVKSAFYSMWITQ
jgi:hypothetical protein